MVARESSMKNADSLCRLIFGILYVDPENIIPSLIKQMTRCRSIAKTTVKNDKCIFDSINLRFIRFYYIGIEEQEW